MGYYTDFQGELKITPTPSIKMKQFLDGLFETRRVKRNSNLGIEGEFEVFDNKSGYHFNNPSVDGLDDNQRNIIDYNTPPRTQPGLWCSFEFSNDDTFYPYDGKNYGYIEWVFYIINKVLKPNGYALNGVFRWRGEDFDDIGTVKVENNILYVNDDLYTLENYIEDVRHYDFKTCEFEDTCKTEDFDNVLLLPDENISIEK